MALSRGEILENPKVIGSTTNSGEVRILDGSDTDYVALSVPDTIAQTYTIDFPNDIGTCLLYTSPSPRDRTRSRMPSSA